MGKEREHIQWFVEDALPKSHMLQQFTGSIIKLEKQCQVSRLKGQKLLPILQYANIWAFVGLNCLTTRMHRRQPRKCKVLVAILNTVRSISSAGSKQTSYQLRCPTAGSGVIRCRPGSSTACPCTAVHYRRTRHTSPLACTRGEQLLLGTALSP